MVFAVIEAMLEAEGAAAELIRSLVLLIILIISVISLYFSRLQGAKIKVIEVHDQTPMNAAQHTLIITNYGNKTGVVIGPEVVSPSGVDMDLSDKSGTEVTPVEARSTVIKEVEVYSNTKEEPKYHLEFKDMRGKRIRLSTHTYLGKVEKGVKSEIKTGEGES